MYPHAIRIQVVRLISADWPGFVEGRFTDAWGKEHIVYEKAPVLTEFYLDESSTFPQDGIIACEQVNEWKDETGRRLVNVTTVRPWDIDTTEGLTEFELAEEQLVRR